MKTGYVLRNTLCTGALALCLAPALFAQTLKDIGAKAPTPGAADISQLSTNGNSSSSYGGLNYSWDNGPTHAPNGAWPGESFTTGSDPGGYQLNSLAIRTAGISGQQGGVWSTNEAFCLNIYILSTNGDRSTLIASYVADGDLLNDGDWMQWSGLHTVLAPNTQYAYAFGRAPGTPGGWEYLSVATGDTYKGGQIGLYPSYGNVSTPSVSGLNGTFDIGLGTPDAKPVYPYAPPVGAKVTNGVALWTVWDYQNGLTAVFNAPGNNYPGKGGGNNGFGEIMPLLTGEADAIYGPQTNFWYTSVEGPFNGGTMWNGSEAAPTIGYADRMTGVFIPPVTTNYVFFINSDDYSQFYLSSDITESNKQLIAEEDSWSNPDEWTTSAGGSATSQKRSDQFTLSGTITPQYPNGVPATPATLSPQYTNGIFLVQGYMYFFELIHENGNGGYNDGVTYKYVGAPDPNSGDATLMTGSNIAYVELPPASESVTFNTGAKVTNTAYSALRLWYTLNDTVPNGGVTWMKNGQVITNTDDNQTVAGFQYLNTIVGPNDDGAKYTVAVTYPLTGVTVVSDPVTLTVLPGNLVKGGLKREFWTNSFGLGSPSNPDSMLPISALNLPPPNYTTAMTNFNCPVNDNINDYNQRVSGFFIPPTTGNYVFFDESDDNSQLFLSTDSDPSHKRLIAQETSWANDYEWTTDNGGGIPAPVAQKRSDQWSPDGGTTTPYSAGIPLVAGQMYYIEGIQEQGGGGDNFAATFTLLADANALTNGTPTALTGDAIAFETVTVTGLAITQQPTSPTVYPGQTATFTVGVTTTPTSELSPSYQWSTNGVPVPGGTGPTLTLPNITLGDANATVSVAVSIPFTDLAVVSTNNVKLNVIIDPVPPTVVSATGEFDSGGGGVSGEYSSSNQYVDVVFDKAMGASALNVANYTIAGAKITNAFWFVDNQGNVSSTMVILQLEKQLTGPFTLNVSPNVVDLSQVGIAANTAVSASVDPLTSMDLAQTEVWTNGTTYYLGDGNYEVDASGNDIWNNADGFRFVYQPMTNNFDVKVQVVEDHAADSWSKAGLMAREAIDPGDGGSRMVFWITTPEVNLAPLPLDGGAPENSLSQGARTTTDGGGAENPGVTWGTAAPFQDGNAAFAPHYPNVWLRMKRDLTITDTTTNDLFTSYYSTNGTEWEQTSTFDPTTNGADIAFPSVIYVGMCLTAHVGSGNFDLATAIFNHYGPTGSVGPSNPTLTVAEEAGKTLTITWAPTGGSLYSSPVLVPASSSEWTLVTASNPATGIPITGTAMFFLVK
jgi:hypothetical protein